MPRFTIEGNDYINFGSNNYLSLLYHPQGDRGRPGGHPALRHRGHRLPPPQRHPRPPPHPRGRAGRVLRARSRAGVLHRLRRQREHHQRAAQPPRLRRPRQGRPQLAAHRRPALGRHHEALRSQRHRAPRQDPRRPAGRAGQGASSSTASTPWVATPRRSPRLVELCGRYPNTFLLDDEAHGLGVLGARGRGAAEQYGVLDTVDLITITFSKTLGSCGGALIGSRRRDRAAHPRRRPAHLHRVEHARFGRRRARGAAHPARAHRR